MQKVSKIWIWLFVATLVLLSIGGASRFLHEASVDALFPLENGVTWFKRGIARRLGPLFKAQAAVSRIAMLEDEVERLRLDSRMLAVISEENAELRRRLDLPPAVMRIPVRCLPVSWGGALGWWQSVRVNKGEADGVAVGDAAVTSEGLVGRVRAVSERTSEVELITDPNCRIACSLELPDGTPSVRGLLQGCGWKSPAGDMPSFLYVCEPMRLEYISRDAFGADGIPVRVKIVTSGLSETIPGGITVGWLMSRETEPNGLYGTGSVLPAVDFASLKSMFILVNPGRRQ